MRALELSSHVPMKPSSGRPSCESDSIIPMPNDPKNCICASAGFFIHIGGINRSGTYLVVHRPYFQKGKFGELSQDEAKRRFDVLQDEARTYMQEMDVPKHIQEDVLGTPSDKALVLDDKIIKTYFQGELPFRHEWNMNKCSKLTANEAQRYDEYARRIAKISDFTKNEKEDLASIIKKQDAETKCYVALGEKSRENAYVKFFGVKPSDTITQNFDRWPDATKYLGRSFYEILAEEKFKQTKIMDSNYLSRDATASSPNISLFDIPEKKRIVSSAILYSSPNPSPEFVRKLVSVLEAAWGVGRPYTELAYLSKNEILNKWVWIKEKFKAELSCCQQDSDGPSVVLKIDIKEPD